MTSKSDKELRKEIAYLTNLIESHKQTSVPQHKPTHPSKQGRTNKFKWTANSVLSPRKHITSKPALLNTARTTQPSSARTHTVSTPAPRTTQPSSARTHTVSTPASRTSQPSSARTHTAPHTTQPLSARTLTVSTPASRTTQPSSARTHTVSTPASRTVLQPSHTSLQNQPSNPHLYRYSNRHHHGNLHSHGNPRHRSGNRRGTNRKWSNMVYLPLAHRNPESKATTSTTASTSKPAVTSRYVYLKPRAGVGEVKEKESRNRCWRSVAPAVAAQVGHTTSHTSGKPAPSLLEQSAAAPRQRGGSSRRTKSAAPHSTPAGAATCAPVCSADPDMGHSTESGEVRTNRLKWSEGTVVSRVQPQAAEPSASAETTPTSRYSHPHDNQRRLGSGSANSTRYKWRRRSTSWNSSKKSLAVKSAVSKSPTPRAKPHAPPWVVHNRYKLTHASIVHKYSKIMHRQRLSSSSLSKLSRSLTRRTPSHTTFKKLRPRNKVWLASDYKSCGNSTKSTTPTRRLSGHELKTRQGNRQWVAKRVKRSIQSTPSGSRCSWSGQKIASNPHPLKRLVGQELKTRHGNRQWVSRHVRRTLQLTNSHRGTKYMYSGATSIHRRKGRGGVVIGTRGQRNRFSLQLVSLSGQKFVVDSSKRRMKRLTSSSASPLVHRPRLRSRGRSVTESSQATVKQYLASRAVQRSRVYVWTAKQRKKKEAKQYCIFYNRFGKCNRGDACPYIHDPGKVAICTKFLRGMCDKTDGSCLFSHTISKDKMPTCSYFLRGVCTREVCPYLHVSVGRHAKVCLDFARGYCPNGEECTKQHVVDCPDYSKGSCPRGDKCLLRHKKIALKKTTTRQQPVAPTKTPLAFKRLRRKLPVLESEHAKQGSRIRHTLVAGDSGNDDKVLSHDEDSESCDDSSDDQQPCYSPLDPNRPAPDFLAL